MTIKDRIHDLGDRFSKDHILDSLGLQEKREPQDYILPALGIFGAGLAVGAVLGLLFAPKAGNELRADVRRRIDDVRHRDAQALPPGEGPKADNPYAD